MYCNSYLLDLSNYLKHRGAAISQVSKLLSIVYEQIDRVFPNGLHDLYICSDLDLEFVRNLLYVTPKPIDPTRINKNEFTFTKVNGEITDYKDKRTTCEFQATLFHSKSLWLYEQVRAEIHRRQQARITPEMRALTAAKNAMNLVKQLETLQWSYAKAVEQAKVGLEFDGSRLNWGEQHKFRETGTNKELTERAKEIKAMSEFIQAMDTDTVVIPSPPKPHKPYTPAVIGKAGNRKGKKWEKWVAMSLPEEELPDTYDRHLALIHWGMYLDSVQPCSGGLKLPFKFAWWDDRSKARLAAYQSKDTRSKLIACYSALEELGLEVNLESLYQPKWVYIPPSVYETPYQSRSPFMR